MKLKTHIPLKKSSASSIDYNSKILLLGSCFSEHIGDKFSYFKFKNMINPFGILFHPLAIEQFIDHVVNGKVFNQNDVFFHNEAYHCFDAHSSLNSVSEDNIIESLNNKVIETLEFLKNTSHVIITLGTAWAYRHMDRDEFVVNCHKIEQKQFSKELLSINTIVNSLNRMIELIRDINSKVEFIVTVSPVRHIKDGFVENTRSKSHLVAAIHKCLESYKNGVYYFPSYEIMMDELRDYRFYNQDMIHPNQTAIDYIWEQFQKIHMVLADSKPNNETRLIMKEIDEIQRRISHRPLNPISKAHKIFLKNLNEKREKLTLKYPHIQF